MHKVAVFLDASCFPTIASSDISYMAQHCDNFVITPVLDEIKKGQTNNPTVTEFGLILDNHGNLRKEFYEVSLDNCDKDDAYKFRIEHLMFLKKNPLLCSAYYTWITSATNPAILHDLHRHAYNEILYSLKANRTEYSNPTELEAQLRVQETQILEKYDKISGRQLVVTRAWLLRARRKRLDEIKEGKIILSDDQTVTTALLFACAHSRNVVIQTSDRDLVDIKDNLYKSIVERYSVYKYLAERANLRIARQIPGDNSNEFELTFDQLKHLVLSTLDRIKAEKEFIGLVVSLYRADKGRTFMYHMRIPLWLRDFILEYKKNVVCLSLSAEYESLYRFQYTMHPNFQKGTITYKVYLRRTLPYKVCLPTCHKYCKYPNLESNSPSSLTDFLPPDDE